MFWVEHSDLTADAIPSAVTGAVVAAVQQTHAAALYSCTPPPLMSWLADSSPTQATWVQAPGVEKTGSLDSCSKWRSTLSIIVKIDCIKVINQTKIMSSAQRQKGLTGYCFKFTDRPFCFRSDDVFWYYFLHGPPRLAMLPSF